MSPLPLHLRSRLLAECLAAGGDEEGAKAATEEARECAALAGSFELGVYDAWSSKVVQESEMCAEDLAVIAALRGSNNCLVLLLHALVQQQLQPLVSQVCLRTALRQSPLGHPEEK